MDNMGLLNKNIGSEELLIDICNIKKKYIKKGHLINKFIEKFPKVKLHTIIEIHKYYNCNYVDNNNNKKEIINEEQIINDYLMNY
jgi:hypothetical protein